MEKKSVLGDMSEGLLRQRRNLISVSCILIFLKFAGVEISKLSFLGIDFGGMKNPSALYFGVWIVFFYFLFRYYQYFKQDGESRLISFYKFELSERVYKRTRAISKKDTRYGVWSDNGLSDSFQSLKKNDWRFYPLYSQDGSAFKAEPVEKKFGLLERIKCRCSTSIFLILNTSAITDYILPFVLAILTLAYCFYGSNSSLFESISHSFGAAS